MGSWPQTGQYSPFSSWIGLSLLDAVLWIRIGFNADPDPSFRVDLDPGLDPDPGI